MTIRLLRVAVALAFFAAPVAAADPPKEADKPAPKAAEATAKITVRDVNLYVMSAYGNSLNNRDLFKSTLPGFIGVRRATAERKHLNNPSPAGLITFEGESHADVDVLLEFTNGRFFGNWPPCPQKSKRLLWVKSKLTKEPGDVVPALPENHWLTFLRNADRLWFGADRRSERFILYDAELPLPTPVKVALAEGGHGLSNNGKYALHDVTIYKPEAGQWFVGMLPTLEAAPKKEEKAEAKDAKDKQADPEAIFDDKDKEAKDKAAKDKAGEKPADASKPAEEKKAEEKKAEEKKTEEKKASDTTAAATPTPAAAVTPAPATAAPVTAAPAVGATPTKPGQPEPAAGAQPADAAKKPDNAKVVNVPSSTTPQGIESITATWSARLKELGLGEVEAEYLCRQIVEQALRTDSATIVFRLSDEQLEELFPLEVTPAPQKQIRIALVVLLDSDPDVAKRVEELVKKLGDPSYAEREAAMEALRKLGPAAKQKVQEAVSNTDAEIAFRAEQLAESIDNPAGQAAQPRPGF